MDPQDFIDDLYLNLFKQGWTLNDIDTMDIIYYLKLLSKEQGGKKPISMHCCKTRKAVEYQA